MTLIKIINGPITKQEQSHCLNQRPPSFSNDAYKPPSNNEWIDRGRLPSLNMTSWYEIDFYIPGLMCWQFIGIRWTPDRGSVMRRLCFFAAIGLTNQLNKHSHGQWNETPLDHMGSSFMMTPWHGNDFCINDVLKWKSICLRWIAIAKDRLWGALLLVSISCWSYNRVASVVRQLNAHMMPG